MGIQASNNLPNHAKSATYGKDFSFRESYITPFNISAGFQ